MTPTPQLILSVFVILVGPGCVWLVRRDIRRGKTTFQQDWGDSHYDRREQPYSFWACIVTYAIGGILASISGGYFLIDAIKRLQL
jgi:uncharacterized membrane protein